MIFNLIEEKLSMKEESNDSEQAKRVEEPQIIWYVYMCISQSAHYYVGISPNPEERVIKHNSGDGSKMAKDQGLFTLVYISKPFPSKSLARKREIQLKGWTRIKKEKLISGAWE